MQDGGNIPTAITQYTFELDKSSLTLTKVKKLIKQLSNNSPTNPSPDGASFSTDPFLSPPENMVFEVHLDREKKDETINNEELALILANVREYLRENSTYLEIAQNSTLKIGERAINGGNFLFGGISKILGVGDDYESEEQGLKDSLKLLLQLVDILQSDETTDKAAKENFIAAQIPTELQRYVDTFNLADWKTQVFPIVQQLHNKVAPYETIEQSNTTLEHTFPDYRKFLNAWIKNAFETNDQKIKKYFDAIPEKTRKELQFADSNVLAEPLQKAAEDERALEILYEKFNKVVEAIYKEKPIKEALKALVSEEDLLEGGGGESDASEDDEDQQEEVEEQLEETIPVKQAEDILKAAVYELLLERLEIEKQIEANNFLDQLPTNAEKTVFREQVKVEIYAQILNTTNFSSLLKDESFYQKEVIVTEPFIDQLESLAEAALLVIDSSLLTPKKGYGILTVSFQFAKMTSNDYVAEDLTAAATTTEQQQALFAGLPAAFVAENNIQTFEDLNNVSAEQFLQVIRKEKQQSYLQEKRRLENVFLSYLQNHGTNISQLSELDVGMQMAIDKELDAYFSNLSSEELARFFIDGDSSFRLIVAARLNRELLLGRFETAGFYTKLHKLTQDNLSKQQAAAEKDVNKVLQSNNQEKIALTQNSPEDIDRMSIKEFQKAFPNLEIKENISPENFELLKRQAVESWKPANAQQGIVQRLMVAYGDDTSFIYTLDTVDKINLIFGLNLPDSLTNSDLLLIQQSLEKYWQIQIDKVANERNYYLNKNINDNLSKNSNSEIVRNQTGRLTSRQFTPVFSQTTREEALLSEQAELLEQAREIDNYNFRLYLTQQELQAQERNLWNQRALLAYQLLNEQAVADLEREASLAALLEAQITTGYQQQAQQGRIGRLARRFGIGRSGKDKAKDSIDKTKKAAVQAALSAANPALGTANRISDWIEKNTGLSKSQQVGVAVGGVALAIMALLRMMAASVGSFIGGVAGFLAGGYAGAQLGATIGSLFGPAGTVIGGAVGGAVGGIAGGFAGSSLGHAAGNFIGGNLLSPSSASSTGLGTTTTATATTSTFASTATVTMGTFAVVTTTAALLTQTTINSALLLPTLGEDNNISRFVIIEKTAVEGVSFENNEFPNAITYQVSIRINEDSDVTVTSLNISDITDTLSIRSNDEALNGQENIKTKVDFGYAEDEVITILPGEVIELEYTQDFDDNIIDASINNRFEINFDVTYTQGTGPEITETTTAFTAETICVGNCPSSEGCWPASGIITQLPFGTYSHGPSEPGDEWQHGAADSFDIAANTGTPVYSPFAGTAIIREDATGYGNHIRLTTTDGTQLLFGHLAAFADDLRGTSGSTVDITEGQLIGAVGSTGNSSGPHLHYEVAVNGGFYGAPGNSVFPEDSLLATMVPDGVNVVQGTPTRSCAE